MSSAAPRALKTPRLILTPVQDADATWLQRVMEAPEVNSNTLVIPTPCPPGFARTWVEAVRANGDSGKAYTFSVALQDSLRPIGSVFLLVNATHSHAELGYFFDPAFWNRGYASEASSEMLRFAFETLSLNRVFAVYFAANPASGKVMEKIGMRHEGCRRQHIRKGGAFVDIEQYGVLRDEWRASRRQGSDQ